MTSMLALGALGLLLLTGLVIRAQVRILRRLLLPVSVVAGFVGLAVGPYGADLIPTQVVAVWSALPGLLINVVFAALFLGVAVPSARALVRIGGPLLRFTVVTALGQYVVAFVLTLLVLGPVFGTPDLFACILEVGFAGGHGTAAAMTGVFNDLGFEAGGALGQMSATVGIIAAVVGGMMLVHWGVDRGAVIQIHLDPDTGALPARVEGEGFIPPERQTPGAMTTLSTSVLDSFTFHVSIALVAILLGWILQIGIRTAHPALSGFPLFPLAMIGGMLVQLTADRAGVAQYFDRGTFQRIMGLSLDLLIVAAIASLRLDLFLQNLAPFLLLMVVGVAWTVWCFMVLAPRILRIDWFEQAITVYGTMSGVTAVGLMLLRVVDSENRTTGAQAFAAESMISSPLIGGGLVTATIPLMIQGWGMLPVLGGVSAVMLVIALWPGSRLVGR